MNKRKEIREVIIDGIKAPDEVVDFFNRYMIGSNSASSDLRIDLLNICFMALNSVDDNTCPAELHKFSESCEIVAIAAEHLSRIVLERN